MIVPLTVNFGTESFHEGIDIDNDAFFRRLANEKALPTTSQPSVGDFVQAFERALQQHEQVIGVFLSGRLSGAVRTAETAARIVGSDIAVIDSNSASYGVAFPVIEAARMALEGCTRDEIVARIQEIVETVEVYFVVDSLEHLHRGGRISSMQAAIGSLLQIKPMLTVRDGAIEAFDKVRTRRRALERLFELIRDAWSANNHKVRVTIVHALALAEAESLCARIRTELHGADGEIGDVGPVLATHVGPGVIGAIFYPF